VLVAVAAHLAACALQSPLSEDAARNLKGRRLTTIVRYTPSLSVVDESYQGPLDPLNVVRHAAVGDALVRDNHVQDPALGIASRLRDDIGQRYALHLEGVVRSTVDDDPTKISDLLPEADLVLDIWTDGWSLKPRARMTGATMSCTGPISA